MHRSGYMISVAEVKRYGARLGLHSGRVASAESFPEYVKIVQNRIENGLIPAESQSAEGVFERSNFCSEPGISLPQAKSIMSLEMRYLIDDKIDDTIPGVPCCRIGRHLWRDLPHKLVAKRVGVGSYGKNCLI